MRKLLSILSVIGISGSTLSAVDNVVSCSKNNSGFAKDEYKNYFSIPDAFSNYNSTKDGNSCSWTIHTVNESQEITVKKAGFLLANSTDDVVKTKKPILVSKPGKNSTSTGVAFGDDKKAKASVLMGAKVLITGKDTELVIGSTVAVAAADGKTDVTTITGSITKAGELTLTTTDKTLPGTIELSVTVTPPASSTDDAATPITYGVALTILKDDSVNFSTDKTAVSVGDKLILKNNDISAGTLSLSFFTSKDDKTSAFKLDAYVSNDTYLQFFSAGEQHKIDADGKDTATDLTKDFTAKSSSSGTSKSTEGFNAGADYAKMTLAKGVSSIDIDISGDQPSTFIPDNISIGTSKSATLSGAEVKTGDDKGKVVTWKSKAKSGDTKISINLANDLSLNLEKTNDIFIAFDNKQQNNIKAEKDKPLNIGVTFNHGNDSYNLAIQYSGDVNGLGFVSLVDADNKYPSYSANTDGTGSVLNVNGISKGDLEIEFKLDPTNFTDMKLGWFDNSTAIDTVKSGATDIAKAASKDAASTPTANIFKDASTPISVKVSLKESADQFVVYMTIAGTRSGSPATYTIKIVVGA
ncbi:hypothetical protein [Spiroplasma endosymbiont of Aspidapion aeneum]|uniref:hypothetical protein n=1 Tax=Spiroplasma endosymbiont of Aspidapion aeneum TaxID=3066276 RepID=UPI00313ADFDA